MADTVTLEQVRALAERLPPDDRLKLAACIYEQLGSVTIGATPIENATELRERRRQEAEKLLAQCDAAADLWEGPFDAATEIRKMRAERDELIWPSK